MTIEKLVNAEVVAEVLGISVKTIKAKHRKLGIPSYKVGWLVKFRLSDVEAWIESRKQKPKSKEGR